MIYCKKLIDMGSSAIYNYSSDYTNLDGEIEINTDGAYWILKEPSKKTGELWVQKMIVRNMDDISNSIFKDKMAYEA